MEITEGNNFIKFCHTLMSRSAQWSAVTNDAFYYTRVSFLDVCDRIILLLGNSCSSHGRSTSPSHVAVCEMVEFYDCASSVFIAYNNGLRPKARLTFRQKLKMYHVLFSSFFPPSLLPLISFVLLITLPLFPSHAFLLSLFPCLFVSDLM